MNLPGLVKDLVNGRLGVLTFDLRAHSESRGGRNSLGHHERTDLLGAIDFLLDRGIARGQIGVVGFSLGAIVALLAASEEPGLAGIVLDSPFADLGQAVRQEASRRGDLPGFLIPSMMLMERVPYGIDLARVRPMDAAREIRRPALFIHGRDDELVDDSNSVRLFEAVGVEDKEL